MSKKSENVWRPDRNKSKNKRTGIGKSKNSKPKNKHKRRILSKHGYRGQGK